MPAFLAAKQMTLVAAIVAFNTIARLYEKYTVTGKDTLDLVTSYDDRVRHN